MSVREEEERMARNNPALVAFDIGKPGIVAVDRIKRRVYVTDDADGRRVQRQAKAFGWTSEVQR